MAKLGDYESMIGGLSPGLADETYKNMTAKPPKPRAKPQVINSGAKGDAIKKKNGGRIDGVAARGKTRGKSC